MSSHAGNTNTVWVQTGRASARLPKRRIDSARFRTRKGTHRSSFVRIRQCRNDLLVIGHVDALDRDLHAEGRRDQRHTEGIHTTRSVVVRRYRSLPSATRASRNRQPQCSRRTLALEAQELGTTPRAEALEIHDA
jgi:hypothetical protein